MRPRERPKTNAAGKRIRAAAAEYDLQGVREISALDKRSIRPVVNLEEAVSFSAEIGREAAKDPGRAISAFVSVYVHLRADAPAEYHGASKGRRRTRTAEGKPSMFHNNGQSSYKQINLRRNRQRAQRAPITARRRAGHKLRLLRDAWENRAIVENQIQEIRAETDRRLAKQLESNPDGAGTTSARSVLHDSEFHALQQPHRPHQHPGAMAIIQLPHEG